MEKSPWKFPARFAGYANHLLFHFYAFFLAACNGGGGGDSDDTSPEPVTGADWTYMVYMGADNNLSTAGLFDLNEMETAGSGEKVNIVLQAEFSSFYTDFGAIGHDGYKGETLRFLVSNDGNPDNVNLAAGKSIGNVDMGYPASPDGFYQVGRRDLSGETLRPGDLGPRGRLEKIHVSLKARCRMKPAIRL